MIACALGADCTAQMPWPVDPPRGWVRLTITGKFDGRTVVLCPKHARELDDLLKGIGGALGDIHHGQRLRLTGAR